MIQQLYRSLNRLVSKTKTSKVLLFQKVHTDLHSLFLLYTAEINLHHEVSI